MITEHDLVALVDSAFDSAGHRLSVWPDPHPDRAVLDEEYSRLTNPGRWRIIGARADAWFVALGCIERASPGRRHHPRLTDGVERRERRRLVGLTMLS